MDKRLLAAIICLAIAMVFVIFLSRAMAEDMVIYQTIPGSNTLRDWTAPALVIKGNTMYETLPGSMGRNYNVPAYKIERSLRERLIRGEHQADQVLQQQQRGYRRMLREAQGVK